MPTTVVDGCKMGPNVVESDIFCHLTRLRCRLPWLTLVSENDYHAVALNLLFVLDQSFLTRVKPLSSSIVEPFMDSLSNEQLLPLR